MEDADALDAVLTEARVLPSGVAVVHADGCADDDAMLTVARALFGGVVVIYAVAHVDGVAKLAVARELPCGVAVAHAESLADVDGADVLDAHALNCVVAVAHAESLADVDGADVLDAHALNCVVTVAHSEPLADDDIAVVSDVQALAQAVSDPQAVGEPDACTVATVIVVVAVKLPDAEADGEGVTDCVATAVMTVSVDDAVTLTDCKPDGDEIAVMTVRETVADLLGDTETEEEPLEVGEGHSDDDGLQFGRHKLKHANAMAAADTYVVAHAGGPVGNGFTRRSMDVSVPVHAIAEGTNTRALL